MFLPIHGSLPKLGGIMLNNVKENGLKKSWFIQKKEKKDL